jgi:hypothetical protein
MIKNLTKIANKLDEIGLTKEADILDSVIRKLSQSADYGDDRKERASADYGDDRKERAVVIQLVVKPGQNLYDISKQYSFPVKKTLEDNVNLNKEKNPSFNPDVIKPGQTLFVWAEPQAEGMNMMPTDL